MNSRTSTILLLLALGGLVGGMAFVYQWWTGPSLSGAGATEAAGQSVEVIFPDTKATAESQYEVNQEGHYDFPFENPNAVPMNLGLELKSCKCQTIQVLVLPVEDAANGSAKRGQEGGPAERWQPLEEGQAVLLPPHSRGIFRMGWKPTHASSERLTANLWMEEASPPGKRIYKQLELVAESVATLQVSPATQVLDLDPAEAKIVAFWCWSSTRADFPLAVHLEHPAPGFRCWCERLTASECQNLENDPDREVKTHVRDGYRVLVEGRERTPDGLELDLGPYKFQVILNSGEEAEARATVTGVVRGDIRIITPGSRDKIHLSTFPAADGTSKEVTLEALRPDLELGVDREEDPPVPSYLQVELKKEERKADNGRTRWKLKVSVPPGQGEGPLPANSKVVLKTHTTPPRRFQIPITGIAYH
jgi:hypothetical protein